MVCFWLYCPCGAVFDLDEDHCPVCDPGSQKLLKKRFFSFDQIKKALLERRFWTKHLAVWDEVFKVLP